MIMAVPSSETTRRAFMKHFRTKVAVTLLLHFSLILMKP